MITNNNTEALATMKTRHIEGVYPDETYITVSSVFSRVGSYENGDKPAEPSTAANAALDSLRASAHSTSKSGDEESTHDLDLIRRSNALSVADELATLSFMSLGANQPVRKGVCMSFGSLPLPGVDLHVCSRGTVSAVIHLRNEENGISYRDRAQSKCPLIGCGAIWKIEKRD